MDRSVRQWVFTFATGGQADDTGVYIGGFVSGAPLPGQVAQGGNFIASEETFSALLRKYDFDGNLLWAQEFVNGDGGRYGCGISFWGVATYAATVYVVGQADESYLDSPERCVPPFPGSAQVGVLMAYDEHGRLLWTRRIRGGPKSNGWVFTGAKTVRASEAGVFVSANLTTTFAGTLPDGPRSDHSECSGLEQGSPFFDQLDAYVRRYDLDGNVIWTHQFGSSVFDIVHSVGTDGTSVYAVGDTGCRADGGEMQSGGVQDSFVIRMALDPTSPSGCIQLIVGRLETLSDAGSLTPGNFNAFVKKLEGALTALADGNEQLAEQHLEGFVTAVSTLEGRGELLPSDADALTDAATAVISQI